MVQIIQENKKRTFGQKLNEGLGRGLESGSQMMEAYQQKKLQAQQMQQENEAAKHLGIDLSGINDPKMRQEALAYALQGINQKKNELLKQEGKRGLLQEKQSYLDQIFGGKAEQSKQSNEMQQNPSSSSQKGGFSPLDLSDADIARASAVDPNMGRILQQQKDVALREQRANRDFEESKRKSSPEFQREQEMTKDQAKADVKYNQQLQETSKQHELKDMTLEKLEKLNAKGVTGKPWEKLAEKLGLVNFTTEGRREFAADVKNLITDIRSILGGQFSNFEFQTILNAYPSADFSKEANASIIKNLKDFQDIKKKEVQFAEQLKKENGGKIPPDFQSQVNERVRDYAAQKMPMIKENARKIMNEEYGIEPGFYLMFAPDGEPLQVSPEEIEKYESLGASLP